MRKTIAQQLAEAQVIIDNALNNPDIRKPLEAYGYDTKRIRGGKVLLENVVMLQSVQKKEYGMQYRATDQLQAARQEAETLYKKHLNLARMALPDDRAAWNTLQLIGARQRSVAGWLSQARIFYNNVVSIDNALESFGVTREELATAQAMVEAVAAELAHQKSGKSVAQASTRQRNEALDALNQWIGDFLSVARIALRESPRSSRLWGW